MKKYNLNKKIFSMLLVFVMLFSFSTTIFAENETTNNTKKEDTIYKFEGVIINKNNPQLATSSNIYELTSDDSIIMGFLDIIVDEGVKVELEGKKITENKLNITYLTTPAGLPDSLKERYNNFMLEEVGIATTFEKAYIVETNNQLTIVVDDKIYNATAKDEIVKQAMSLLANSGTMLYVEGTMFKDYIEVTYLNAISDIPKNINEKLSELSEESLKKITKEGVLISEGKDSYLLVEKDTNKMYYVNSSVSSVRDTVPILANTGQQVRLYYDTENLKKNNILVITKLKIIGEIDKDIEEKINNIIKKQEESIYYYLDGTIKKENEDYNFYYLNEITNKTEKIGIVCQNEAIIVVIKEMADTNSKARIEGFVNAEKTLFDVRKITLLDKEDTNLQEKIKNSLKELESKSKTTGDNVLNKLQESTNPQNNTSNNTSNNTNTPSINSLLANNNLNSSFGNLSSFFANFDMSNFGNFNSLFGNNGNGETNNNSLFSNFNLNSSFGDLSSLFNNGNNTSLFANFFNNTQTQNSNNNNETTAFATN